MLEDEKLTRKRMLGRAPLTLLILTAIGAIAVAFFALKDEPAQATRYVNMEHGYEFSYDDEGSDFGRRTNELRPSVL